MTIATILICYSFDIHNTAEEEEKCSGVEFEYNERTDIILQLPASAFCSEFILMVQLQLPAYAMQLSRLVDYLFTMGLVQKLDILSKTPIVIVN